MDWLDETALAALYGAPSAASVEKLADRITADYRRWIEASRFCVLSSVGPGGTDGSPRGDDGPVARVLDERHLALPDWRGKQMVVELDSPLTALPQGWDGAGLSLSDDGRRLTYDYDAHAARTGIGRLLATLNAQGIGVRDVATRQSSLEDIFLSLLEQPR